MTAQSAGLELPELPPSLDEVSVFMGARSDEHSRFAAPNGEYFSEDDMREYGRQCALAAAPAADGDVRRAESARAFMGDGQPMVCVRYYWPHEGKLLRHTQFVGPFRTIEQAEQIVTLLLAAAPQAQGEGNG